MLPFRKNVALAVDGGGVRGVIVARALAMLEEHLGKSSHDTFRLVAGTSTGSVIASGIAAGLTGREMYDLYIHLGEQVFPTTWRSKLWPLTRYRYSSEPLRKVLQQYLGDRKLGEFWSDSPPTDLVITTFDLKDNRTRFVKPWKEEYRDWLVVKAVMASSSVPTYFPVVEGRYVDGGVGSYANPCYLAAYELTFCLDWDPAETTLISLGTGRSPHSFDPKQANSLWAWQWINPILGAFQASAEDQQVHLVDTFFGDLDFRRFQVDLRQVIPMDDASMIPRLSVYGDELGRKILNDQIDAAQEVVARPAPKRAGI
jgi:predicted acylesterase/phospholipase RssA